MPGVPTGILVNPLTVEDMVTVKTNGLVGPGLTLFNIPIFRECELTDCREYGGMSAVDILMVDALGRMTGAYYENGIYVGDRAEIPGSFYSGHLSHPNFVYFEDASQGEPSHVILQPTSIGAYTFRTRREVDGTEYSHRIESNASSLDPIRLPPVVPGNTNSPLAVANSSKDSYSVNELVLLDGSQSADPKGGSLTYKWAENASSLGSLVTLNRVFPAGYHLVRLTVTNSLGYSSEADVAFSVGLGATHVSRGEAPVPGQFMLYQNYPNPFNPSTTIRYGLPNRSHVALTVFNSLGQRVAVLQNGEQEAGYHEVKFDASGLSSGVYFYRLRAGDFVETKRLLVMK